MIGSLLRPRAARHRKVVRRLAVLWSAAIGSALLCVTPAAAQIASAPKRPAAPVPAQSCTTECHKPIVKFANLHNPSAADCSVCHIQVGDPAAHKFSYTTPKEELCLKCHQLPAEKFAHAPVAAGQCAECHDPHGSDRKALLKGDPNRTLCVNCHNEQFMKKAFVHGPVAVGACATCHKPHSSDTPKLLLANANSLCVTCHADTAKPGEGVHMHKALDQGCVSCHDAHASDHKFQLVESSPKLCLSCHGEQFNKMTDGAKVIHGAITEEGGCTACHEPHASKLAALQRTTEPESCLKCHDKPTKDQDGVVLANMSSLLNNNPNKHGPIRDGHCSVCHDPHASKNFRLLPAEYPGTFYAPFSMDLYKLCFQCHTSDMVTKANGQGVTQFRDGSRNLHALHVNQTKGRTCRACHEVHASNRDSHVRESVPFGSSNWMLEINYTNTETGGSCAPGCHAPKEYKRPSATLLPPRTTMPAPEPTVAPANTSAPADPAPAPDAPAAPDTPARGSKP
jgi:predicted CXXCH cytochrome family protein